MRRLLLSTAAALILCHLALPRAFAQTAGAQTSALTGKVTSTEEGPMEGVLVSAKKAGTNITITVVSDAAGNYSFPATKLSPGEYALRIRAIGYDLDNGGGAVTVGAATTTKDLTLRKTEDLAAQMSNAEWLASFPGNDQQKNAMLGCVGCHTIERIARSTYKPDDFINVTLPRMQGYVNQSIPQAPQLRKGERRMEERGDQRVQVYRGAADFLSSINQSSGRWNYALKTAAAAEGPQHPRRHHRVRPAA